MSLQSLIREGDYATAQEAFDAITTPVESRNSKAWTVTDLAPLFPDDINTILGTLKSVPVFESAFIALSITGLELATDARQSFIDQVADVGQWSDELKLLVKRLGRPMLDPWQVAGIATEPTLQQVTDAFNAEIRWRAYQSIVERATAATEAAAEAYRSPTPTPEEITTAGEEAFEVV